MAGLAKSSLKQLLPRVSTDLLTSHLKTSYSPGSAQGIRSAFPKRDRGWLLHQRSWFGAGRAQDKEQLIPITCDRDRSAQASPGPTEGFSACHPPSLAKYRKMLFSADMGRPNKAVQLCLLTAQLSPQAACEHAWLSREGTEGQHGIEMPQ